MKRTIVGLTGPTGCGKTIVSSFLADCGFEVLDADKIVKDLYLNCSSLINEIDLSFVGVVEQGSVNKMKLADIVFSSETERLKLEKIVWPFVIDMLKKCIKKGTGLNIVIDAPTLFESGVFKLCDFNIAVLSSRNNRLTRIIKRDGLTEGMAIKRINSQKPDSFYIERADGVVLNDGLKKKLFNDIFALIARLKSLN